MNGEEKNFAEDEEMTNEQFRVVRLDAQLEELEWVLEHIEDEKTLKTLKARKKELREKLEILNSKL